MFPNNLYTSIFYFQLLFLVSQFLEEESTAERHLSSICRTYTSGPSILRPTLQCTCPHFSAMAPTAVHWPPLLFIITIGEKYLVQCDNIEVEVECCSNKGDVYPPPSPGCPPAPICVMTLKTSHTTVSITFFSTFSFIPIQIQAGTCSRHDIESSRYIQS